MRRPRPAPDDDLRTALARLTLGGMVKVLGLVMALAACSTTPAADDSPTYNVTWTSALTCPADAVSHPCPYQVYSQLVTLNTLAGDGHIALTWWGADVPGDRGPTPDLAGLNVDGSIGLVEHGDDGGERRASTLAVTDTGYVGDVVWTLFNVAGDTKWHVAIEQ